MRYFSKSNLADRYVMTNIVFAAVACIMTRWVLRWLLPYVLSDMPREVAQDLTQHTWRSYTSSVWDGIYQHGLLADSRRLDPECDVVFLHGELDKTAPLSGVRQLILQHADWQLHVLPGSDHHPMLRDPEWCLQVIGSVMRN